MPNNPIYEFQFTRKNLPYYVDVHAKTIAEAVEKANTIANDFVLVPELGDTSNQIKRVVLKWDGENDPIDFNEGDIIYVYDLTNGHEVGMKDLKEAGK